MIAIGDVIKLESVGIQSMRQLEEKISNGEIKLDLGGGNLDSQKIERYKRYLGEKYDPKKYLVLDKKLLNGVDLSCDISTGLPFFNNSLDEIICIHVLEHIKNLEFVMKEINRVLKPNGLLRIWVPHCFSAIAYGDSTHERYFTFETFSQFDKKSPGAYYYDFHFNFVQSKIQILRRWYNPNLFDRFIEKIINYNQRRGERFLKIFPYKEWEVHSLLQKDIT